MIRAERGAMGLHVTIVTLFPEMFQALTDYGISGRAAERGLLDLELLNPRDFTSDKHRTVDDRPYGGGPGMLMKVAPLRAALAAAGEQRHVVYLSPQGRSVNQQVVQQLRQVEQLVLLCGRYEGVDERLIEAEVDEELSIGDFVLSGGEIAAMALIDAMIRLEPGTLGHQLSAQQDSFAEGLLSSALHPPGISGRTASTGGVAQWRSRADTPLATQAKSGSHLAAPPGLVATARSE